MGFAPPSGVHPLVWGSRGNEWGGVPLPWVLPPRTATPRPSGRAGGSCCPVGRRSPGDRGEPVGPGARPGHLQRGEGKPGCLEGPIPQNHRGQGPAPRCSRRVRGLPGPRVTAGGGCWSCPSLWLGNFWGERQTNSCPPVVVRSSRPAEHRHLMGPGWESRCHRGERLPSAGSGGSSWRLTEMLGTASTPCCSLPQEGWVPQEGGGCQGVNPVGAPSGARPQPGAGHWAGRTPGGWCGGCPSAFGTRSPTGLCTGT